MERGEVGGEVGGEQPDRCKSVIMVLLIGGLVLKCEGLQAGLQANPC
jgi:hypothetical protein